MNYLKAQFSINWILFMSLLLLYSCSDDDNVEPTKFQLSDSRVSHLYWPFYNSNYEESIDDNISSAWQGQIKGELRNASNELTIWRYQNDHEFINDVPTHHINSDWFAQDWNYFEGGNSDCGMSFFAPMSGKIIRLDKVCDNTDLDCDNPACNQSSPFIYGNQIYILHEIGELNFVFRAAHFSMIDLNIEVDQWIDAGRLIGQIGNEGNSTSAHLHASLWKNLSDELLDQLISNAIDLPNDGSLMGSSYAADFLFDVENGE